MVRRPSAATSSESAVARATGNPGDDQPTRRPWTEEERAAWRRRREERRAKQRAQNFVRARQMHEARLQHDVAQPPPAVRPADTAEGVGATTATSATSIFVGCSGWYYWH